MTANTKENLVRVLKGQDPIQSIKCRLGWHRWTTWEHVGIDESAYHTGVGEHIRCHCADCGLVRVEPPYSKRFKRR